MRWPGIFAVIAVLVLATMIVASPARPAFVGELRDLPGHAAAPGSGRAIGSTAASGLLLEIGIEHVYQVSLAHEIHLDAVTSDDFKIALAGTWAVAYAGSDARGLTFRAELREGRPAIVRNGIDVGSALAAKLAEPYYFTTTPEGRLISLAFAGDVGDAERAALTTLASSFQVTAGSREAGWQAVESDSLGDYQARYARRDHGVHRERIAYQRVAGGGPIGASIVTTGTDVVLRGDGWPDELAGHEVTRVGTDDLGVIVDARFELHHGEVVSGVDAGWPDGLAIVGVDAGGANAAANARESDRELVDGATFADLLAELARVGDDAHARGYMFLRLAALFRIDPAAVRAAGEAIRDGAPAASTLIGALGEAGTPAAQHALGDVLGAPERTIEGRVHAAIALGLTEHPTPETLQALANAAATGGDRDLSSTATLAQGNAALHMHDSDPGSATAQIDALLARLARAGDDQERELVLRALGNTGDPRILPALATALASPSTALRAAATEALRLVPGAAVDRLILDRLADPIATVRASAVFAAGPRELVAYAAAFDRGVRHDPDVEVRRAIIALTGPRLDEIPALRTIIEYAAGHEADAELRATARSFLSEPQG